jgi:PAS domain-containing protein
VIEPFKDIEDARALAQAIVDTVREPLLVLDDDLCVLAVSRSFYLTFRVDRQDVLGRHSTRSATVSGRFQLFARFWRKSSRSAPPWTRSRSSMSFPGLAAASCS